MKEKYIAHLLKAHPTLSPERLDELVAPQLLSPFQIELSKDVLAQAQKFAEDCFALRENPAYQSALNQEMQERGLKDPGNKSICMSYDFHLDPQGQLKLIEVNTNAAFLALGYEMYKMRGVPLPVADFTMEELKSCIENEIRLQGKQVPGGLKTAIIDEEPEKQRLFVEFLVYQSYFQQWGWQCEIVDYRQAPVVDFIYNRFTDFYLSQPESRNLREMYLSRSTCLSPNPFEYFLLADKQRMIDWWGGLKEMTAPLQAHLPQTKDVCPALAEEIWAERKKFFFKPKRAFGSKQTFKGASISRRAFDEIVPQDMIAQEYVQAPEQKFMTPDGEQSFKYDLRFYAYQGRIQMVVARLYQGQVTNLRTPYGGFAPVLFKY